jgi:hypothetical protein
MENLGFPGRLAERGFLERADFFFAITLVVIPLNGTLKSSKETLQAEPPDDPDGLINDTSGHF